VLEHLTGPDAGEILQEAPKGERPGTFVPEIESFRDAKSSMFHLESVGLPDVVDAQFETAQWLQQFGDKELRDKGLTVQERHMAQKTFSDVALGELATDEAKDRLLLMRTPRIVQHFSSMLHAYNWKFEEQAAQIRAFLVATLLQDAHSPKDTTRLKAIQMLGQVSEIGLFSTKIKLEKPDEPKEGDVDERIREKLKAMREVIDVVELKVDEQQNPKVKIMPGGIPDPEYVHFPEKDLVRQDRPEVDDE
jgi:hypothetical protein